MAAKKLKKDRHLVQALVEPELLSWVETMAKKRELKVGAYVRALLRWCKDSQLGDMGYQRIAVKTVKKTAAAR